MNTPVPTGAESAAKYFITAMMIRAEKKRFEDLPECAVPLSSLVHDREVLYACHDQLRKMEESGELAARGFEYSLVHRSRIVEHVRKLYLADLNVFTICKGNAN